MYKKAFTLIELLVVIAIIGILASIILVSLSAAKAKARDAKRIADIKNIQVSLEDYYNDNLSYPAATTALVPNYMSVIPVDPTTNAAYFYAALNSTSANGGSNNCSTNPAVAYHLGAALEANNAITGDADAAAQPTGYQQCSGDTDFNGTAPGCIGVNPAAGGADNCYDVTN